MTGAGRHMRIYLVRHAEPALPDYDRRFIGAGSDPPLSPEGLAHAQRAAEGLGGLTFDTVWSSGMTRAVQTATALSGLFAFDIRRAHGLREIELGEWEAMTVEEARRQNPVLWAEREKDVVGFCFPGGESFRDLQARALQSFYEVVRTSLRCQARTILVVAHKSVNRALLCGFWGRPLEEMFSIPQDYCAVSLLEAVHDQRGQITISVQDPRPQ